MSTLSGSKHQGPQGQRVNYRPALRGGNRQYVAMPVGERGRAYTGTCVCLECHVPFIQLSSHLRNIHNLTTAEYRARHGATSPMLCQVWNRQWHARVGETKYQRHRWLDCEVCGRRFERMKGKEARTHACSAPCRAVLIGGAKRRSAQKVCPCCGTTFAGVASEVARITHCSHACALIVRHRIAPLSFRRGGTVTTTP